MDVPDADHVGRRGGALHRSQSADEAHHPRRRAGAPAAQRARASTWRSRRCSTSWSRTSSARSRPGATPARQALDGSFDLWARGETLKGQLVVEKQGSVGWIVFDQPARRNAINDAMWRGIPPAMEQFDADPEVRCVAFRGAGHRGVLGRRGHLRVRQESLVHRSGRRIRRPPRPGAACHPGLAQALGGDDLRLLSWRRGRDRARLRPSLLLGLVAVRRAGGTPWPRLQRGGAQAPARDRRPCARAGDHVSRPALQGGGSAGDGAGAPGFAGRRAGNLCECGSADAVRQRAAVDRQYQDHPRGIREVLGRAGRGPDARGDRALRARARTTRKAGARSWRSASPTSRADEDSRHSGARGGGADEAAAGDQHRRGHRGAAGAGRPARPTPASSGAPTCSPSAGTTWRRIAKLVEAMARDAEGRRGRAFRHRAASCARDTRCSACTTSCSSPWRASTWRPGTRSARRSASRWCGCWARRRGRSRPTTPRASASSRKRSW